MNQISITEKEARNQFDIIIPSNEVLRYKAFENHERWVLKDDLENALWYKSYPNQVYGYDEHIAAEIFKIPGKEKYFVDCYCQKPDAYREQSRLSEKVNSLLAAKDIADKWINEQAKTLKEEHGVKLETV